MKTIVITGEDRHIDNIAKEQRFRIKKGWVSAEVKEDKPKQEKPVKAAKIEDNTMFPEESKEVEAQPKKRGRKPKSEQ